jgi:hypothetical protein
MSVDGQSATGDRRSGKSAFSSVKNGQGQPGRKAGMKIKKTWCLGGDFFIF